MGRIDLAGIGLANRVEMILRNKAAATEARIGIINTILKENDARFRPVLVDLKSDPGVGELAMMNLGQ